MSNNINAPVFEIKDSFIIKHLLNYNTSYDFGVYNDGVFESYKQRMVFTDYELARKSQIENVDNFQPIKIYNDLNSQTYTNGEWVDDIDALQIQYLDYEYTLKLDGNIEYENIWSNNVFNYFKPLKSQKFIIDGFNDDINVDEYVSVDIYEKQIEEVTDYEWEFVAVYSGEKFYITGETDSGTQWIKEIIASNIGYNSGTMTFNVETLSPVLRYDAKVLSKDTNSISIENKIDMYLFNNFSSVDDLYFKIISNNHCDKKYTSIINKLKYFRYYKYFEFDLLYDEDSNLDYLYIKPILNTENIYVYYDKFRIKIGLLENFENDDAYIDDDYLYYNYLNNFDYYLYLFYTDNIYSKYTLNELISQFINTYECFIYNTNTQLITSFDEDENYLYLGVSDISVFTKYTYVKLTSNDNTYNAIIIDITDNVLKLLKPLIYTDDQVLYTITNLGDIKNISYVLEKTFLNYEYREYRKIGVELQRKIYNAYAEIYNKLIEEDSNFLRIETTGIIFQNSKNKMVLKIFDPTDFKDKRLTYTPTELTFLGKDKKTSIPILVNDVLLGISANLLDPNYNTLDENDLQYGPLYVLNSNVDEILLVIDANKA